MDHEEIKKEIEKLIMKYFEVHRTTNNPNLVRYGGSCHDSEEIIEIVNTVLDGWWIGGKKTVEFEQNFCKFLNVKNAIFCNSGSSANLIALNLTDFPRGSEFITPATNFPTTINPAIQNGMKPVVVDSEIGSYTINTDLLDEALSDKTKALVLPHLIGNVPNMRKILKFVKDNDIFFMEDCCDAFGSKFDEKFVGTFGNVSTFSFYPSHHITAGGGGMIVVNDVDLLLKAKSLTHWGRAFDNANDFILIESNKLRKDFDLQYTYTTRGFNVLATEVQAALGLVQLKKAKEFESIRRRNFKTLMNFFRDYEDFFILPQTADGADPVWFCFPLTIKKEVRFTRKEIMNYLYKNSIESRYIMAGNIVRQPAYKDVNFRIVGDLKNSDKILTHSFFIGLYQCMNEEKLNYVFEKFREFIKTHK